MCEWAGGGEEREQGNFKQTSEFQAQFHNPDIRTLAEIESWLTDLTDWGTRRPKT